MRPIRVMPAEDFIRMREGKQSLDNLPNAFLVVPVPAKSKSQRRIYMTLPSARRVVQRAQVGGREMEIIEVELTAVRRSRRWGHR